eukprot:4724911-Pleurochrysis_carterae.AAC.2
MVSLGKLRCPSGLRGATQVRMVPASWVRIPLEAFCITPQLLVVLARSKCVLYNIFRERLFVTPGVVARSNPAVIMPESGLRGQTQ